MPGSLAHAALLLEMSETADPPCLKALTPVLRRLARRGRERAVDAVLVERYVRF